MRVAPNVRMKTRWMARPRWARTRGWFDAPLEVSAEQLILAVALFWTLAANSKFLMAALQGRSPGEASTWGFGIALAVGVWAIHTLLLSLVGFGRALKPLMALLLIVAASASYFISTYGVYLDPSMLRNVVRTDPAEAGELIGGGFLLHLVLYAGLPLLLLWRVKLVPRPWKRAVLWRVGLFVLAFGVLICALMSVFQPLSSQMRNHKELRYLITPANVLWSGGVVVADEFKGAAQPRQAIGLDAKPGASWAQRRKPLVVVMVVGETARAANWGLSGYARQTTPELAAAGVINFPQVGSCGTNTEVSLPCMFAPVGRRDYDEGRIVQDHRHADTQAGDGFAQRHRARQGLLQQQGALQQLGQRWRGLQRLPEVPEAGRVAEGFIAVECHAPVAAKVLQHLGDACEPFPVGFDLAAELEFEVMQAVSLDGSLQGGGQAVLWVGARVAVGQAVGQSDGVAQHHLGRSLQRDLAAPGIAQYTGAQTVHPRQPSRAQRGVGHRLVQQGWAELRRQSRQAPGYR